MRHFHAISKRAVARRFCSSNERSVSPWKNLKRLGKDNSGCESRLVRSLWKQRGINPLRQSTNSAAHADCDGFQGTFLISVNFAITPLRCGGFQMRGGHLRQDTQLQSCNAGVVVGAFVQRAAEEVSGFWQLTFSNALLSIWKAI